MPGIARALAATRRPSVRATRRAPWTARPSAGHLAAAVAVQHDVLGEQRRAGRRRRRPGPRRRSAARARRAARGTPRSAAAPPRRARRARARAGARSPRSSRRSPRPRRSRSRTRRGAGTPRAARATALSSITRNASDSESAISAWRAGSAEGSRHERLGQPFAHVGLPSHARRAQHVDGQPGGDRRHVGPRRLDPLARARARACSRSSASWTTSSASATLPSIRYAIAKAAGRSSSSSASCGPAVTSRGRLGEALAPARVPRPPAELSLRLLVRGSAHLGHHDRRRPRRRRAGRASAGTCRGGARPPRWPRRAATRATGAGSSSTML